MVKVKTFENYPSWIVSLSTLVAILIYALGAYIIMQLGLLFLVLYLLYCFWIELKVLRKSCVDCYYYGKFCAFGRGKLCSLLFKKGKPENFAKIKISLKDILPDFLVFIFPLVGGIILLIQDFSWTLMVMLALLLVLSFAGNAIVRGNFACKFCKQRELGCPAEKVFRKRN